MALTHKQRRFVQEYLRSETATEAALRAGYASKSAPVIASRMMDDPEILAAIEEGQKERLERVDVDADYLLKRLHEEVNADLADLYDEESGDLLPVHEWPEVWRRGLVAGVEVEALFEGRGEDRVQVGHVRKLKLSDRVRRIEALGRHVSVNAFRENIRVEGLSELADRLARAGSRADREDVMQRLESASLPPMLNIKPEPVKADPSTDKEHEDVSPSLSSSRQEPGQSDPPAQVPPTSSSSADWTQPAAAAPYQPILPSYPEGQTFAACDYDAMPGSLLSAYRD